MDYRESVFTRGREKALINIISKYETIRANSQLSKGNWAYVSTEKAWQQTFEYVTNMKKCDKGHWWITINPPTDSLENLQDTVSRIRSYSNFLGDMVYCYEVRSDDGGLHVHMLAEDVGKKKAEIIKRCHSASKHYYKAITPESFHVEIATSKEDCLKYLRGEKDDIKYDALCATERFRKLHSLADVYRWEAGNRTCHPLPPDVDVWCE